MFLTDILLIFRWYFINGLIGSYGVKNVKVIIVKGITKRSVGFFIRLIINSKIIKKTPRRELIYNSVKTVFIVLLLFQTFYPSFYR